jgi:hypothetical protein
MPQVLLLIAAGLFLARRYLRKEQGRVAEEIRAAREAMERRNADHAIPLEKDPRTGIYRPKQMH